MSCYYCGESDAGEFSVGLLVGGICGLIVFIFVMTNTPTYEHGYKQAMKDHANGGFTYELSTNYIPNVKFEKIGE